MMDTRAGAITDGQRYGVNPLDLRDAAGHMHLSTTDRYARGRSEAVGRVIQARFGKQ